jgi:hypothetical protein
MIEHNKATVRRLIEDVLNGGHLEAIDELYAPELAPAARRWITPFRASFPDVHMEVIELIAEGDKVVGRFTCSATHLGVWLAMPRPAGASSGSMRSPSSGCTTARSSRCGHWKTHWGGSSSSAWPEPSAEPQVGHAEQLGGCSRDPTGGAYALQGRGRAAPASALPAPMGCSG